MAIGRLNKIADTEAQHLAELQDLGQAQSAARHKATEKVRDSAHGPPMPKIGRSARRPSERPVGQATRFEPLTARTRSLNERPRDLVGRRRPRRPSRQSAGEVHAAE